MKSGNHGFPQPVFPVYSPGPAYAVGESGSHEGDRTKQPGRETRDHQRGITIQPTFTVPKLTTPPR